MSRQMYMMVEGDNVYVDREDRVITRLINRPNTKAYQVDSSTEPPTLEPAELGSKAEVVATLVMRDLVVGGESVAEARVQEEAASEPASE